MIGSHEGDTEAVIPCGGEIYEPRRFEDHPEAEPTDVEVPAFDALVRHDYRVEIFDLHDGRPLGEDRSHSILPRQKDYGKSTCVSIRGPFIRLTTDMRDAATGAA
jgi:hypothetical protein